MTRTSLQTINHVDRKRYWGESTRWMFWLPQEKDNNKILLISSCL